MASENLDHLKTLARIKKKFGAYRQGTGKRRGYPSELKELVIRAFGSGIQSGRIASAAGVTRASIFDWKKSSTYRPPREIQVIENPVAVRAPLEGETGVARICFRSGVFIELPVSALKKDFFTMLEGGAK